MIIRRLLTSGRHHVFVATDNLLVRIATVGPFFAHHETNLSHGIGGNHNGPVAYTLKAHLECLLAPLGGAIQIRGKVNRLGLELVTSNKRESECIEKIACGDESKNK
jgi:hypothetical protein